jgi:hypothetical protein
MTAEQLRIDLAVDFGDHLTDPQLTLTAVSVRGRAFLDGAGYVGVPSIRVLRATGCDLATAARHAGLRLGVPEVGRASRARLGDRGRGRVGIPTG